MMRVGKKEKLNPGYFSSDFLLTKKCPGGVSILPEGVKENSSPAGAFYF